MASKILSGPRAVLLIGEKKIGWCTNVSVREEVELQPHDPIGQIETAELVPTAYRVSGSAATARIINEPATKHALFPDYRTLRGGGTPATMQIVDDVTKKTIATVYGVKFNSREMSIEGRAIVGDQIAFQALTLEDEHMAAAKPA